MISSGLKNLLARIKIVFGPVLSSGKEEANDHKSDGVCLPLKDRRRHELRKGTVLLQRGCGGK